MTMNGMRWSWARPAALLALAAAATGCDTRDAIAPRMMTAGKPNAQLGPFGTWSAAMRIEAALPGADPSFNTTFLDGCPVSSRDGKTFFLASNRPGGVGGIDIWVSRRESVDDPWGAPVNVGEPINSASNDFCPMPARDGHEFFFVSNRPGGCGGDDIYVTRFRDDGTIDPPENLGCDVNSAGNEAGPVPITEPGRGPVLYFSSTRAGGFSAEPEGATSGDADLYSSEWKGGRYQSPTLVAGVNSEKDDMQPYIQRDALEVYFSSNRGGNPDIWVASRAKAQDEWSAAVNVVSVNSGAGESRPSLSWDGTTLYFGSTRSTGDSNIYVSFRDRLAGQQP
jgi:WD40 repeat protein